MNLMAEQSQDVPNPDYIEAKPDSALADEMLRMVKALEAKVVDDNFETVDGEAARRLFAAMIKVYSLRIEAGERDLPVISRCSNLECGKATRSSYRLLGEANSSPTQRLGSVGLEPP
jgi:hypothetical protein